MDYKLIFLAISTLMVTYNYVVRFRGFYKNDYSVHPLSVGVWLISTAISFVFLVASGNILLSTLSIYGLILQAITFFWSVQKLRSGKIKTWHIEFEDYVAFGLALLSLAVYYLSGDPVFGMIIMFAGEISGEIPQLRKNYLDPQSDKLGITLVAAVRAFISVGTLEKINVVGILKTAAWGAFILLEAVWLVYCQKRIEKIKNAEEGGVESREKSAAVD